MLIDRPSLPRYLTRWDDLSDQFRMLSPSRGEGGGDGDLLFVNRAVLGQSLADAAVDALRSVGTFKLCCPPPAVFDLATEASVDLELLTPAKVTPTLPVATFLVHCTASARRSALTCLPVRRCRML